VYRAGDARFRRLLMNKLQLTKGELTKIILEEVRKLQEQPEVSLTRDAAEALKPEIAQTVGNLRSDNDADQDKIFAVANLLGLIRDE
jgi:hypothetical protein